jgi:hypothetical protein
VTDDVLEGHRGRDELNGGHDDDRLDAGPHRDVCEGSAGTDTANRCEVRISIP